jgi:hypothetical protein
MFAGRSLFDRVNHYTEVYPTFTRGGISVMSVIQTRLSSTGLNGLFNVLGRTSCDRLVVKKMNIIADNQQNKNFNKINDFSE